MTQELADAIEKLRFQLGLVSQTIDYKSYPIERLVLEMDWSDEDLSRVNDIFSKWDMKISQGEEMRSFDFEYDFQDQMGIGYQSLKGVVNAFYRNDQWVTVCEAFVDSMGPSPSVEYLSIARRERD